MDTIRDDWRFTPSYDSSIREDAESPEEASKTIRIRISFPRGKITEAMPKLESLIGYTHDEISGMKSRFDGHSTTPFDPNAIRIAYFEPGMIEPFTDFGFKHKYSGHNLFDFGRGTYTINLRFPTGYFDPQDLLMDDELESGANIDTIVYTKNQGQSTQQLMGTQIDESSPDESLHKSAGSLIYAIVNYREKPLGKVQQERFPVAGGNFPFVYVESKPDIQAKYQHTNIIRYETHLGEEIDVLWAEIHRNDEDITPRFLQLSYEVTDSLIDHAPAAKGNPGSLKAVIFESDGQTIRCFMSLNLWTP
ncbi:hypothetical protein ACS5NO_14545 [Larkinella sp. GY13]|uniref:hypothetical protein n=1 Tax=Larkinella sp. GY13 TaxID=3453720 RepID=UPI003EEB46C0